MVHGHEDAMCPIRLDAQSAEQLRELDKLYHRTHDARVMRRAQMILLAAEQGMVADENAAISGKMTRLCDAGLWS
jgi:hypothetical protein